MKNLLLRVMVIMALAASVCLPGLAHADYVQTWEENGLYGGIYKTWDTAEAFLLSPGISWVGAGLTINSGTGWTATLISPTYARATGDLFNSSTQGNFYFTTQVTDLTGPFSFDWVLSNHSVMVGVQRSNYTSGGDWSYSDVTATPPSENRSPVPLPPTTLLLGSGLVGLGLLRRKPHTPA